MREEFSIYQVLCTRKKKVKRINVKIAIAPDFKIEWERTTETTSHVQTLVIVVVATVVHFLCFLSFLVKRSSLKDHENKEKDFPNSEKVVIDPAYRCIVWVQNLSTDFLQLLAIHWIVIHPVDSVIHPLSERGLVSVIKFEWGLVEAWCRKRLYSVRSSAWTLTKPVDKRRTED